VADLVYFAPAKVNFSLLVAAADSTGYHPLRSLTQALDWGDTVEFDSHDEDMLEVVGDDLATDGSNLIWKAVASLPGPRPRLSIRLTKRTPLAAGLGGGSSDAAAALRAMQELCRLDDEAVFAAAPRVGADVTFFLVGGTAWMEGYGERITRLDPLMGFSIAIVVPPFELPTPDVYRRWDQLGGPEGDEISGRRLPPALRELGPIRNDLTPAAVALRPELGDWIRDLSELWERPVALSGSGPSVFAWFSDEEEARAAVSEAPDDARCAVAASPSGDGAVRVD
jgi:4-diphosphocytidyl-2-C-methyl-D-erythritol kinase